MSEVDTNPLKRGPGRPRKDSVKLAEPEVVREQPKANKLKMKAKPNWEDADFTEDSPDRLKIDRALWPDGMELQWITDTVRGESFSQHRSRFERRGWTPVHQSDFNGQFDGMFMPKGKDGEITVEGLVLMARPIEFGDKARKEEYKRAREQVRIKEQALQGGDLPGVTLDASHPTAIHSNRINKTVERIEVPGD